jgi:site-specific DNA recombinase
VGIDDLLNQILNADLYLRRSRQDIEREKKFGIDTLHEQRTLMYKEVKKYPFAYTVYEEIGSGDKISSRPVFQSVLDNIKMKKTQAIIVKDFSRLGRGDMRDSGFLYDFIQEHNVLIITPNKIYDPNNPSDLQMIRFEMFFYREEFEMIKKRLTGSRYTYALEGKWMTGGAGIPYGYQFDPATQKLTPHLEQGKVVTDIFRWYVNEEIGLQAICSRLRRLSIKTKMNKDVWTQITVRRMLENDVYIGTVRWGQTKRVGKKVIKRPKKDHIIVPDAHAPLVDKETFEKAQIKLGNQKAAHPVRTAFSPGILAGIVTCPICGRKMMKNGGPKTYIKQSGEISVYHQSFLSCIPCSQYAKYDSVVSQILAYLESLKTLDEETLIKKFEQFSTKKETYAYIFSFDEVKKQIESLEKRRATLLDLFLSEHILPDIYQRKEQELIGQIVELKKKLEKEPEKRVETRPGIPLLKKKVDEVIMVFHLLQNDESKNELLRTIISECKLYILQKGAGRREAKFELLIRPNLEYFQ